MSDAIGTIANGRPEAVSVTVDEMVYHTRAVRNGVKSALVVTTLPFGSYNCVNEAASNATRIMKEGRADAVHLEGTAQSARLSAASWNPAFRCWVTSGLPNSGSHFQETLACRPRMPSLSKKMINDAVAMAKSGAFGLIIECLPVSLGEIITRSLDIPVISIGSGVHCDGQGLVTHDMLGLFKELRPGS